MENNKNKIYAVIGPSESGKSTLISKLISKSDLKNGLTPTQERRLHKVKIRGEDPDKGILFMQTYEMQLGCTIVPTENIFEFQEMKFSLIDTPGNLKYLKNLLRGVSYVNNAILLISLQNYDFIEIREFLLITIGMDIRNIIVAVNFSLIDKYNIEKYKRVCLEIEEFTSILKSLNFKLTFIPVSILEEENVFHKTEKFSSFYDGPCLINTMGQHFEEIEIADIDQFAKLLVVDKLNLSQEIVIVKIACGTLQLSDELVNPKQTLNKISQYKVRSIEKEYKKLEKINNNILGPGSLVALSFNDKNMKTISRGEFLYDVRSVLPVRPNKIVTSSFVLENNKLKKGAMLNIYLNSGSLVVEVEDIQNLEDLVPNQILITLIIPSKFSYRHFYKKCICLDEYNKYTKHGKFFLRDHGVTVAIGFIDKLLYI
jgi:sulfate adenylyltransferase subunit 1 (EFTu-like GTPase family)